MFYIINVYNNLLKFIKSELYFYTIFEIYIYTYRMHVIYNRYNIDKKFIKKEYKM